MELSYNARKEYKANNQKMVSGFEKGSYQAWGEGCFDAQKQAWKNYYLDQYNLNPYRLSDEYGKAMAELKELKQNFRDNNTWFIVINPDPEKVSDYEDCCKFKEVCLKALRKVWIVEGVLWFEWRSEQFSSIHANFALTKSSNAMSMTKREFYNTFKNWIGKDKEKRDIWINVQQTTDDQYKKICNYQFDSKKFEDDKKWLEFMGWDLNYSTETKRKRLPSSED